MYSFVSFVSFAVKLSFVSFVVKLYGFWLKRATLALMSAVRIALAMAISLWAAWELFDYFLIKPQREAFAKECLESGRILIPGRQGQMCMPQAYAKECLDSGRVLEPLNPGQICTPKK